MNPYTTQTITGALTDASVNADKQVRDVDPMLHMLYKQNNRNPFLALQSKFQRGAAMTNPKMEWPVKDWIPRWSTVSSIQSGDGTAAVILNVDDATKFIVGYQVRFPGLTGENTHGKVSAIDTANDRVTITHLDASSNLTLAGVNQIEILAYAAGSISRSPSGIHAKQEFLYNYPQYLRRPSVIDIYEKDMKQYTGSEEMERKLEDELEIMMDVERIMFHGKRSKVTGTNDGTVYTASGVDYFIDSAASENVLNWSTGTMTQNTFDEFIMDGVGTVGSKTKWLFCSTEFWNQLHDWVNTEKRIQNGGGQAQVLGILFEKYLARSGQIFMLHHHHLLNDGNAGEFFLIDPEAVSMHAYGSNPMFGYFDSIQENDSSATQNEWRWLGSFKVTRAEWCARGHQ